MVEISIERFEQLIRAEQVANQLTELIDTQYHGYRNLDRADIVMLHQLYCAGDEE